MTPHRSGGTLGETSSPEPKTGAAPAHECDMGHHERKVMKEIGVFTKTAVVIPTASTIAAAPARCSQPRMGEA